jgi:hypothetical protein
MTPTPKRPVGRPKKPAVGLCDKDDNVKMFHSYEELKTWMDETENSIKEFTGAPKNPDREPATKGYVKCVARKLNTHKHETDRNQMITIQMGGFAILFLLSIGGAGLANSVFGASSNEFLFFVATVFSSFVLILFCGTQITNPDTSDVNFDADIARAIQKYTPPTCEKK